MSFLIYGVFKSKIKCFNGILLYNFHSSLRCFYLSAFPRDTLIKASSISWHINCTPSFHMVDCVWNVMAHAQKPDFVFRRNGRVHLNWRGHQWSRLLAAEVCASAVVMLDTPRSEVVWRELATHSICQFPLHFSSRASPCAITFQLDTINATAGTSICRDRIIYKKN